MSNTFAYLPWKLVKGYGDPDSYFNLILAIDIGSGTWRSAPQGRSVSCRGSCRLLANFVLSFGPSLRSILGKLPGPSAVERHGNGWHWVTSAVACPQVPRARRGPLHRLLRPQTNQCYLAGYDDGCIQSVGVCPLDAMWTGDGPSGRCGEWLLERLETRQSDLWKLY